jgi:four helix bundle protein
MERRQRPEDEGWRRSRVGDVARRPHFRFQDLEIWKEAVEVARLLFRIADRLDTRRCYRWAEQIRAAGLSITNNIAEGSGSASNREFRQYLNIAHRSAFESANVILILEREALVETDEATDILQRLDRLCRKITSFQRTL